MDYIPVWRSCSKTGRTMLISATYIIVQIKVLLINPCRKLNEEVFSSSSYSLSSVETKKPPAARSRMGTGCFHHCPREHPHLQGSAPQLSAVLGTTFLSAFFVFPDWSLVPDCPGDGFGFLIWYALLAFLTSMAGLGKTSSLPSSLPFLSTGTHSPYTLSASFFLCWDPEETGNSLDRLTWFFGWGGGAGFMLGVWKK